jgi:shikimate dehydrogenase
MISGKAKVAGVMGWPVSHSLSPRLHNYWLDYYKIDGMYIPLPVDPKDIGDVVKMLPKIGLRGFNLTLPHKELVIPYLDYVDDDAKAIGAVNTVLIASDGTLQGMNTDAYGFIRNIQPHIGTHKNKAVVLGAGGASKAVCYALIKEGYKQVVLANRTTDKAEALARQFGTTIRVAEWQERDSLLADADLLVNTTSLGMEGQPSLELSLEKLPVTAVVTDIVYTPLVTPLLRTARDRGHTVVDGLGMLIHQAIPAFRTWFALKPEITPELRPHLLKAVA